MLLNSVSWAKVINAADHAQFGNRPSQTNTVKINHFLTWQTLMEKDLLVTEARQHELQYGMNKCHWHIKGQGC